VERGLSEPAHAHPAHRPAAPANAVHPGAIVATNLARHMDPEVLAHLVASGTYTFKTPEQGAATSVLVATSPQLEGIGGRYFEDCNEAAVGGSGVAAYALDPGNARRLWEVSLRMLDAPLPAAVGQPV
jgi:hypothetical protein